MADSGPATWALDHDGRLVLTGRLSPLVNVAGRKVDPAEVERVLALPTSTTRRRDRLPHARAGVGGVRAGRERVAYTVALRRSCAQTLSPYKIPRRFIFLERWPVDSRGKVDKRALEALASDA
jgi:long-chain acyl-CoA synthetase